MGSGRANCVSKLVNKNFRAAFLFDNIGPYHATRLCAASKSFDTVAVQFGKRSGKYDWESKNPQGVILKTINPDGSECDLRASDFCKRLRFALKEANPQVLFVNGWGFRGALIGIKWAKKVGVRVVLMSETRRVDGSRFWMSEWAKRKIVRLCDAGLCGGESHRRYLVELGLPKDRVALGYNSVDNEFFGKIRNGVGISDCPYFLASNRFVERKNLGRLIEAYARYVNWFSGERKRIWPLVLLGDGKLRAAMEAFARKLGLEILAGDIQLNSYKLKTACEGGLVVFPGFRQIDELLEFYAGAGAFVHPALAEPWGLVINEAMASGLPILSSNNVGAAEELLKEGINGFSFDPRNIEELASVLKRMADLTPEQRKSMGAASRKIVSEWGPERFAQGAREAIEKAMKNPVRRAGILDRLLLEILIRK